MHAEDALKPELVIGTGEAVLNDSPAEIETDNIFARPSAGIEVSDEHLVLSAADEVTSTRFSHQLCQT